MTRPPEHDERVERVSTLELFFDLVFVFTITQLTGVLSDDPTLRGLLRVVLMLGVIFYMYGGYAWMTNAVAADRAARRLLLLGGMGGFLVLALAIPRAFSEGDFAFGIAYLAVVGIHTGLYSGPPSPDGRALLRGPVQPASAVLVLAAWSSRARRYALGGAFAVEWVHPPNGRHRRLRIARPLRRASGLVVIVALGESIVAVGIGAAGLPVDLALASVAVLGLLLAACLWWAYFGGDDVRAERALAAVPDDRRGWVAIQAFGYWHLLMLGGIIPLAAGLKDTTATPSTPSPPTRPPPVRRHALSWSPPPLPPPPSKPGPNPHPPQRRALALAPDPSASPPALTHPGGTGPGPRRPLMFEPRSTASPAQPGG